MSPEGIPARGGYGLGGTVGVALSGPRSPVQEREQTPWSSVPLKELLSAVDCTGGLSQEGGTCPGRVLAPGKGRPQLTHLSPKL